MLLLHILLLPLPLLSRLHRPFPRLFHFLLIHILPAGNSSLGIQRLSHELGQLLRVLLNLTVLVKFDPLLHTVLPHSIFFRLHLSLCLLSVLKAKHLLRSRLHTLIQLTGPLLPQFFLYLPNLLCSFCLFVIDLLQSEHCFCTLFICRGNTLQVNLTGAELV